MASRTRSRSKRGPGRIWYGIALALVVSGVLCPLAPGLARYWKRPYSVQFLAPGTTEIQLPKRGNYTLWYDYQTTFNGKSYSFASNQPPGLVIQLKNKATGSFVPISRNGEETYSSASDARISVGEFNAVAPGRYVLSVSGPLKQPAVFSFRENWLLLVVGATFLLLLVGAALVLTGVGLFIVVFVWRTFR